MRVDVVQVNNQTSFKSLVSPSAGRRKHVHKER